MSKVKVKRPKKLKQCPDKELWFPCCRKCSEWYDRYRDESPSPESTCFCLDPQHSREMELKYVEDKISGTKSDCPYKCIW